MDFSLIIVNYRSHNFLRRCLSSIKDAFQEVSFEVVIVNNDKKNITQTFFKKPKIKVLEINKNIGFGAACNQGLKLAQGKIIVFLNPDVEIIDLPAKKILKKFKQDKEIGILGGQLIDKKGNVQEWSVGVNTNLKDIIKNNLGRPTSRSLWLSQEEQIVGWVSGAALFIRRNLVEKLKGFDEFFFLYFEDVDLCYRAQKEGYSIVYYPVIKIKHWGGSSFENKKIQKKEFYKSQDYYFQKHLSKWQQWGLKFLRFWWK